MSEIQYVDLQHDCDLPGMAHLPRYGARHQVMAKWRCPECRQRWQYAASFLDHERMYWDRVGGPSRRWRKSEAARLREVAR
jgi:hypothetical protein